MTPEEILNSPYTTNKYWDLPDWIFPSLPGSIYGYQKPEPEFKKDLLIKEHFYKNFDYGYRTASIRSYHYKNVPFLITTSAGRDQCDHQKMFVINKNVYKDFYTVVFHHCLEEEMKEDERFNQFNIIDLQTDEPRLTNFYGSEFTLNKENLKK